MHISLLGICQKEENVGILSYLNFLTIYGAFDEGSIFIADNGTNNIIILYDNVGNSSKHYDSIVKKYSSDSFTMRNPESGILVFAHSIEYDQYRLVVVTTDKVYRLIGVLQTISELEPVESSVTEPTSSVGADITIYDVPTIDRDDGKDTYILSFSTTESIDNIYLEDKLDFTGYLYEVKTAKKLADADVTVELSRDDYVIRTQYYETSSSGYVDVEFSELDYPEFYPTFCYQVIMTLVSGNTTYTWNEDFVMGYPVYEYGIWEPDMEWLQDEDWDYLPKEFRNEPREYLSADDRCN